MPDGSRFATGRHAGVVAPLFSIPSRQSWGVGEIAVRATQPSSISRATA